MLQMYIYEYFILLISMTSEREESISLASQLVHHPCLFHSSNGVYSSKSIKNRHITFTKDAICCGNNVAEYNEICRLICDTPDLLVFVVFKLLERNIFISTHGIICVSEQENTSSIHCDLIACKPKKHEIYVIVFCNNKKLLHTCYDHAVLIISHIQDICPPTCKLIPMVLRIYDFEQMRLCKKIRP